MLVDNVDYAPKCSLIILDFLEPDSSDSKNIEQFSRVIGIAEIDIEEEI